jgi:hypothetical protein
MPLRTGVLITLVLASVAAPAAAEVSGWVIGANGAPVAGATVSVYDHEGELARAERQAAGRSQTALVTVQSAHDGSFSVEVGRKLAWIETHAAGYAPARQVLLDDMTPVVVLRPAGLRRGVITAGGKPVAGAVVVWSSSDGAERICRTGPDGGYEAPDPRDVPEDLLVLHPDFAPLTASRDQDRFPAARRPGLDQELDAGVVVAGTVVDGSGTRPVSGAKVWIDRRGPVATTDPAGAFRLRAPRGWRILTARAARSLGTAERAAGPLVVRLEPERTLAGTVRDERTGRPLAGGHRGP